MHNQFNSNRRTEERQRNVFVSVILILLSVMTVITLVVVNLPATPAGSTLPPLYEGSEADGTGGEETRKPSSGNYPSVGNFEKFGTPASCKVTLSNSVKPLSGISSQNAIVVDMSTNIVTHAKGADEKIQIASMTKVMTLITAIDLIESNSDFYERVTIKEAYIDKLKPGGYQIHFYYKDYYDAGNTYDVYVIDLLYGLMLQSSCDAALALADHLCGSEDAFVAKMNEKAKELGIDATTKFSNCYGGDDGGENYSTARAVAVMFNYALSNELAKKIITTKSGEYTYQVTYNYNYPMSMVLDGMKGKDTGDVTVLGGKSGNDDQAGYCLVSFGKTADGHNYLVVTAGDKTNKSSYVDSAFIYKTFVGK